jgi:hypothetical protein
MTETPPSLCSGAASDLRIDSPPVLVGKRRKYKPRAITGTAKFKQLILAQDEYIGALANELSDIIENGFAHGWVSERTAEISALSAKIKQAKNDLRQ